MIDRATAWLRTGFAIAVSAALILAGVAFTIAISRNAQTAMRLDADIKAHCITDTIQDNRRRTLDLALIGADRVALAQLAALPFTGPGDHALHQILIDYYTTALTVRLADIPAYKPLTSC